MAPKKALIDVEWAESLLGIRLKVPDHWWRGYSTRGLNSGKITSFDASQQKWMLVIDSEPDGEYPMAYDAI
jgi:hypothetical protein